MPREGYTAITVSHEVEKILRERYEKSKQYLLEKHNITTFSGYLLMLSQKEYTDNQPIVNIELPRFEHFNMNATGVRITDRETRRIADIDLKPTGIYCDLCEKNKCAHIDFALTVPAIKEVIRERKKEGWNLPNI